MNSIHTVLAKKAASRSRSPSPSSHHSPSISVQESSPSRHSFRGEEETSSRHHSFHGQEQFGTSGRHPNNTFLQMESADSHYEDKFDEHEPKPRGSSVNGQPVQAHVSVRSCPLPYSDEPIPIHEPLVRQQHQSSQVRGVFPRSRPMNCEMDELAGAVRSYGSFSSDTVNVNNSDNHDNATINYDVCEEHSASSPSLKRQKSFYTPAMIDELRKRNKLYFLDPITKLLNFHGFPWKLTLQLMKLILITAQIIIFGGQRESIVEYFERSDLSYHHLLLKDWDIVYETLPYPPATGPYAIYNISDLFDHMNSAMERYYRISDWSLAAVHLNRDPVDGTPYPITLCFTANSFEEFPNGSYIVSGSVMHDCTSVHPFGTPGNETYDIRQYLKENNFTLPFNRTLDISLSFYLRTFHLNLLETHYGPSCYNVSIKISYTNSERSGQLLIDLLATPSEIECVGKIMSDEAQEEQETMKAKVIAFDAVVMVACSLSTILCSRSLNRCNKLRKDTAEFFKCHKGKLFSFSSHMEYINGWYIVIICNDLLTVVGSAFKMQLESRVFSVTSENYELCSILLGLGVLLTYVGILRYLGFFKSYNILILTLKTSFPHVLRFLVCAICLYVGFLFCGWVVFSPYHIKFRKLSTASECLFSLVNGDDMFATFSALANNSNAIWYFHRAYLYIFIALFIYVVISVFIAVIMENYENLKRYYVEGFPDTEIQAFIKEDGEMSMNEIFRHVKRGSKWHNWFFCLFPCLACLRRPTGEKSVLLMAHWKKWHEVGEQQQIAHQLL